jgi:hypothetical protein
MAKDRCRNNSRPAVARWNILEALPAWVAMVVPEQVQAERGLGLAEEPDFARWCRG